MTDRPASSVVEKARDELLKMVDDFGSDPFHLLPHVPEVEKWAKYLLKKYPSADSEVVLLGVWMHDLGHYPHLPDVDHAVVGVERAEKFLRKLKYPEDRTKKVLHCIRAHRCRDVQPDSLEAKIIAFSDSASHMTTSIYFDMAKSDKEAGRAPRVYEKLERDMRDLGLFPEVQKEMKELYNAWKKVLDAFEKLKL